MILLPLLVVAVGLVLVGVSFRQRRKDDALEGLLAEFEVAPDATLDEYNAALTAPLATRVLAPIAGRVSDGMSGLLPRNYLGNVRHRLVTAGLSGRLGAEEYVTWQVIAVVVGVLAGLGVFALVGDGGLKAAAAGILLGAIIGVLPNAYLSRTREERVEALERELPDVLDLLAISVEAGVGLEGAFKVVTDRFDSPLSREIGHTLKEMELGLSRVQALQNLKSRTEVGDLSSFILALVQAAELGMPLGRILRSQADEMRRRRQARVREQAARLPVKLLFPLALFILPSLFVVVLGPAMIQIRGSL